MNWYSHVLVICLVLFVVLLLLNVFTLFNPDLQREITGLYGNGKIVCDRRPALCHNEDVEF